MLYIFICFIALLASLGISIIVLKKVFNHQTQSLISSESKTPESKSALVKKYPGADLKSFRNTFFNFGLVLSLAFIVMAFNWTVYDSHEEKPGNPKGTFTVIDEIEVIPPQTRLKKPIVVPPPVVTTKIKIIKNDILIEQKPKLDPIVLPEPIILTYQADSIIEPEPIINEIVEFYAVEEKPEFPGGEKALLEYLGQTPYSNVAVDIGIEGKVFVQFVIAANGRVTNAKVLRGPHSTLNKAALNQIKKMPRWEPGKQRGKAVRVQYVVPINFEIK